MARSRFGAHNLAGHTGLGCEEVPHPSLLPPPLPLRLLVFWRLRVNLVFGVWCLVVQGCESLGVRRAPPSASPVAPFGVWCWGVQAWGSLGVDRLRVGWLNGFSLGGVPREQKMLKGHLPRVIYHQVY